MTKTLIEKARTGLVTLLIPIMIGVGASGCDSLNEKINQMLLKETPGDITVRKIEHSYFKMYDIYLTRVGFHLSPEDDKRLEQQYIQLLNMTDSLNATLSSEYQKDVKAWQDLIFGFGHKDLKEYIKIKGEEGVK